MPLAITSIYYSMCLFDTVKDVQSQSMLFEAFGLDWKSRFSDMSMMSNWNSALSSVNWYYWKFLIGNLTSTDEIMQFILDSGHCK